MREISCNYVIIALRFANNQFANRRINDLKELPVFSRYNSENRLMAASELLPQSWKNKSINIYIYLKQACLILNCLSI